MEKNLQDDNEFEKIRAGCSEEITAVLNSYKLKKKIWILLPPSSQINIDRKWNKLRENMPHIFQNKEDHILENVNTVADRNFIYRKK